MGQGGRRLAGCGGRPFSIPGRCKLRRLCSMPGRFIRAPWWTHTLVLTAAYSLALWSGLLMMVQPEQLAILC